MFLSSIERENKLYELKKVLKCLSPTHGLPKIPALIL